MHPAKLLLPLASLALAANCAFAQTSEADYVNLGAGGKQTGVFIHPILDGNGESIIYDRSDTAGVFRWDWSTQSWVNLMGTFSPQDTSLRACDGLALDPQNNQIVYAALGDGNAFWPQGLFKSADRGASWTKILGTDRTGGALYIGGNDDAREIGEPLAVDPANSTVVYFGSRRSGVARSVDSGSTWAWLPTDTASGGIPVGGTDEGDFRSYQDASVGSRLIAFDPSGGTQTVTLNGVSKNVTKRLYIAVWEHPDNPATYAGVGGIYLSNDGGQTFSRVAMPTGTTTYFEISRALRMSVLPDGDLLVASNNLHRYDLATNTWTSTAINGHTNITAVDVNPANPSQWVCASSGGDTGRIHRSANAGVTWTSKRRTELSYTADPSWHTSNSWFVGYPKDIVFDPHNPGHVWIANTFGVQRTTNLWSDPMPWIGANDYLECTVVHALRSGSSGAAKVMVLLADVKGFRVTDLDANPTTADIIPASDEWEIGGLAFATNNANYVAAAKLNTLRVSTDNGATWSNASLPTLSGYNNVNVALTKTDANGKVAAVWLEEGSRPYVTSDLFTTPSAVAWTEVTALPAINTSGGIIDTDTNGNTIYLAAWNGSSAYTFYISADRGVTWTTGATVTRGSGERSKDGLIAIPGATGEVWFFGTNNRSPSAYASKLWKSTNAAVTFTQVTSLTVDGVSSALSIVEGLAAGAAKPGNTHGSLYLYARYTPSGGAQTWGVLRSDDKGATWTRINTDTTQFACSRMAGDMQTYGRVYMGSRSGVGYLQLPASLFTDDFNALPASNGWATTLSSTNLSLSGSGQVVVAKNAGATGVRTAQLTRTLSVPAGTTSVKIKLTAFQGATAPDNDYLEVGYVSGGSNVTLLKDLNRWDGVNDLTGTVKTANTTPTATAWLTVPVAGGATSVQLYIKAGCRNTTCSLDRYEVAP